ncbi:cation-translocating P-type ATPase C-terminal domain-containing protein [Streptomyces sp. NPDC058657]|uniref:cation-translocating P-type ATPase C-terminal domain-containing protein n=1 Tax=unclassified Streptomyces TaxID=2593676 RepID=UPI00365FD3A8
MPALALGREPAEPGLVTRPLRSRTAGVIDRALLFRAWVFLGTPSAILATGGFLLTLDRQAGTFEVPRAAAPLFTGIPRSHNRHLRRLPDRRGNRRPHRSRLPVHRSGEPRVKLPLLPCCATGTHRAKRRSSRTSGVLAEAAAAGRRPRALCPRRPAGTAGTPSKPPEGWVTGL